MKLSFLKMLWLIMANQNGNFNFGGGQGDGGNDGNSGDGGDGGSGGSGQGDGGSGQTGGGAGIEYKYPETLDKEYHGNPSLLKFANEKGEFDFGKMAKSYINIEKHMGKDKIVKPNENFTEDQWKETFRALGVPEDLNDYKIENNLPEGVKGNDDFVNAFKKQAHEVGILPKQAQKILDFYNNQVVSRMEENQQQTQAYLDEQKSMLTKEWGDAFDKQLDRASQAAKALLDEDSMKEIENMGLWQNATFAKLMAKVADGMDDDKFDSNVKGTFGLSPAEVDAKINEIYNKPEFQNKMHPQNAHYKKEYMKLMDLKVKYKGAKK